MTVRAHLGVNGYERGNGVRRPSKAVVLNERAAQKADCVTSEVLNLQTPQEFRGLQPDLPIRVYHRHLPHWRQLGATYFVTFRLADSIPQQQIRALRRWRKLWERSHPEPHNEREWEELAREITVRTEAWMDEGYGECVFGYRELAEAMVESLLHFQHERYFTSCFAVMPNHVHLIIRPLSCFELEWILDSIKGFISRKVNAFLDRNGPLWAEESYDRIVRDEEHLFRVIQYIGNNPRKAGLPREQWIRWIHPDWEKTGWGFRTDM